MVLMQGGMLLRKILAAFLSHMKLSSLLMCIKQIYIPPLCTTRESEGQKMRASGNAALDT